MTEPHNQDYPSLGYIADTGTPKGRGVFARRDISAGEVVEICPVLVVAGDHKFLPKELQLVAFNWGFLAKVERSQGIALGYGGMYNHANPSNLSYEAVPEIQCLKYVAVQPIAQGEEMTINYDAIGGGPLAEKEHWFRTHDVQQL